MATASKAKQETALAPNVMSDDDMTALLRELGMLEPEREAGDYPQRAKIEGSNIYLGDTMYVSNPKTGAAAMRIQLLGIPDEYQGIYIPAALAEVIGRPDIADRYCKSHFGIEEQKREFAEDGTPCRQCPINPFTKRDNLPVYIENGQPTTRKCSWRAQVQFRVLDANGDITDPTIWSLDLSTTSVIEFKGTGAEAKKGSVSDLNFVQKLVRFGAASNPQDPQAGVRNALNAYRLGGIIADVRQLPSRSPDGARSWYVTSFDPVDIVEIEPELTALDAGTITAVDDPVRVNGDDLPF